MTEVNQDSRIKMIKQEMEFIREEVMKNRGFIRHVEQHIYKYLYEKQQQHTIKLPIIKDKLQKEIFTKLTKCDKRIEVIEDRYKQQARWLENLAQEMGHLHHMINKLLWKWDMKPEKRKDVDEWLSKEVWKQ